LGDLGGDGTSLFATGIDAVLFMAGIEEESDVDAIASSPFLCSRLGADDLSSSSSSPKKLLFRLARCSDFLGGRLPSCGRAIALTSFWSFLVSSPPDPRGARDANELEVLAKGSGDFSNGLGSFIKLGFEPCAGSERGASARARERGARGASIFDLYIRMMSRCEKMGGRHIFHSPSIQISSHSSYPPASPPSASSKSISLASMASLRSESPDALSID
jgi:hypothetical protein